MLRDTPRFVETGGDTPFRLHFILLTCCLFLFLVTPATAGSGTGRDVETNPHDGSGCPFCHNAPVTLLTKEDPTAEERAERRAMKGDLTTICAECHERSAEKGHPVGMPPKLNRLDLPLDDDGTINCATTCHHVHTEDADLKRYMLRYSFDTLCLSCHDK